LAKVLAARAAVASRVRLLRRSAVAAGAGGAALAAAVALVGAVLLVFHLARTGALGSVGMGGEGDAAVRGVQVHDAVRAENEDFAWEIMRRECLRGRGTNCDAVTTPPTGGAGLARPQSLVQFARVLPSAEASAASGPLPGSFGAQNLIARGGNSGGVGWRSASPALPVELAFESPHAVLVDRVAFRQTQASPPASWAKEVELLVDDASVGRWTLGQSVAAQEFPFRPARGSVARLRISSRHEADAAFTSLGAFAVGLAAADPGRLLG